MAIYLKEATKTRRKMFSRFKRWNDPLCGCILLSTELFLHLEWRGRKKKRILRGGTEEDAREVEKEEDDHSQLNTA